jgi:hypothetical protein
MPPKRKTSSNPTSTKHQKSTNGKAVPRAPSSTPAASSQSVEDPDDDDIIEVDREGSTKGSGDETESPEDSDAELSTSL